jgi:large subunit ribosomal protein L15|tara:strand:+ start:1127 stop:1606 length:480 start_codon:yes stop_codon:yes gene_type:complete
MPKLNTIKSNMHKKSRIRVGRGNGSKGTYSGRGLKGQNSRSGGGVPLFFEGGQLPLVKRLPFLRGFKNRFKKDFSTVNISSLEERFSTDEVVNPESLYQKNLIRKATGLVKILGDGKLTKKLFVNVHSVSSSANKKITDAGGNIDIIPQSQLEDKVNDN